MVDLGERRSERHFLQYQKVRLAINFSDSFIFSNKGNICTNAFKTWGNPECDSLTVIRKAFQKYFLFPCWQNKDACDSVEGNKSYVWSQGLIITFQMWLKRVLVLDKMWNSPPFLLQPPHISSFSCSNDKTEHHLRVQRAIAAQPTMSNEPPIGASLLKLGSLVKAWW